jgi:hypothetical protein
VLHARRILIEGVPKLALADHEEWDKCLINALANIDNAIEHIIIVPEELNFHLDRGEHWETIMKNLCSELPNIPEDERRLAVCLHWTFLRHVLPESTTIEILKDFATQHGLLEMANEFAEQIISLASSKEEIVRHMFLTFPEIPKNRAALEYIDYTRGTFQKPIP